MKKRFDTFLAQNKVYKKYYDRLKEEPNYEGFHREKPPEDWIWSAFSFWSDDDNKWEAIATKWEAIANA